MADVVGTGLPYWTDDEGEWDKLILGGTPWPGIWELSGDGVKRNIDLKKSKGADTATLKDEGYKNAKFTAVGTIWNREQFKELQAILPEVHPRRKGGDRQALQIIHPAANLLGIDSVYLTGIKMPKLDGPKGGPLTITITFIEWTPKPKTPKSTGGGCGKAYYDSQQGVAVATSLVNVSNAVLAANPGDVDAINSSFAAQRALLVAISAASSTPCNNKGNQAKTESGDQEDLSGNAAAGISGPDDPDNPKGAADDAGDWS